MALRNIRTDGDECLRKKAREVDTFDQRLWTLLDDMADTMYDANGVGLAAPQIGISRRVVVIDVGEGLLELINPRIVATKGKQTGNEGCLSFPGLVGTVTRPNKVEVEAQDRHGDTYRIVGTELLARAFCHELDHLDGVCYVDLAKDLHRLEDDED